MDIPRIQLRKNVSEALDRSPVCLLLGQRQAGKSHLAKGFGAAAQNYFDLESMVDERRLEENAQGELGKLYGLVVIDEVQRMPKLFPLLRYLADRKDNPAKFLLLGSAAPRLVRGVSESLAGRVAYVDLGGFNVSEIEPQYHETLWLQGGLPGAFLSDEATSYNRRLDYLKSVIEQDMRELAETRMAPSSLRKLLSYMANCHGKVWNHAPAAQWLGVDGKTIQRYVELFEGMFLIRLLRPYHSNLNKRLRKSPTLYFRDSGLVHALLAIRSPLELSRHPIYGFSWEGFALEQVIRVLGLRPEEEGYTYSVHAGDEMDLVVERGGKRYGYEFKASNSPGTTPSMLNSIRDLKLSNVYVVHPGEQDYALSETIQAVGVRNLVTLQQTWDKA